MATEQISPERWAEAFDLFTREHAGKPASVQLLGRGSGDHSAHDHHRFIGVTLETKGSEAGSVRVVLGDSPTDHVSHEMPAVTTVWRRNGETYAIPMLEIKGADEKTLILQIHPTAG